MEGLIELEATAPQNTFERRRAKAHGTLGVLLVVYEAPVPIIEAERKGTIWD
jgi:hypothetical protein